MNRIHLISAVTIAIITAHAPSAFAKRYDREGFNFGLGVRSTGDSSRFAEDKNIGNSETSNAQLFVPHVGYALSEYFNLGINGYFEDETKEARTMIADKNEQVINKTSSKLNAGGLFMRFMFADYMHFEFGVGAYMRKFNSSTEHRKSNGDNTYDGTSTSYQSRGIGPGFHVGFGVEVPVAKGFYVSSNFIHRQVNLKEISDSGLISGKTSRITKRELLFGIVHYVD